jgi:hypothetical protein
VGSTHRLLASYTEHILDTIERIAELKTIHHALPSDKPELVAVWGRRRVCKTFLLRYGRASVSDWYFELTGQHNGKRLLI